MKTKTNSKIIKLVGTIIFLGVFTMNIVFIVKKDNRTGLITLSHLESLAQSSGEGPTITCTAGSYGQCSIITEHVCFTELNGDTGQIVYQVTSGHCTAGGTMADCCDYDSEWDDCAGYP